MCTHSPGQLLLQAHSRPPPHPNPALPAAHQPPSGPLLLEYTTSQRLFPCTSSYLPPKPPAQSHSLRFMLSGPLRTVSGTGAHNRGGQQRQGFPRGHSRMHPHKRLPSNKGINLYGSGLHSYPVVLPRINRKPHRPQFLHLYAKGSTAFSVPVGRKYGNGRSAPNTISGI